MKKIKFIDLMTSTDSDLLNIFENHTDYERPTLIYCYAEIKRRNLTIEESLISAINDSVENLVIESFDSEVTKGVKSQGFDTYEDLYASRMSLPNEQEVNKQKEPEKTVPLSQQQPAKEDILIKCPSCGKDISEKDVFCLNCGINIKTGNDQRKLKISSSTNQVSNNYKVCPFNQSNNIPRSLQGIIDNESVNGWKYINHQYSDKLKPGSAGCFGIGATPDTTIHVGFVVFEKS